MLSRSNGAKPNTGSPLNVPSNHADSKLFVDERAMHVSPVSGEGARLHLRSEVVARSAYLQRAAASPCAMTQMMQLPYDAFVRWFIFVVSDMGTPHAQEAVSCERGKTPAPVTAQIELCSTQELLQVFMVGFLALCSVLPWCQWSFWLA